MSGGPHGNATVQRFGASPAQARHTVIALHGRGASAADMAALAEHIGIPDVEWIAPTAGGNSWWPVSFLAPHAALQPYLDSALGAVERCVAQAIDEGASRDQLTVLGFSQGACLALEYTARSKEPLAAVFGLSGGLVGTGDDPDGVKSDALYGHAPKVFDYATRQDGLSVYIGCHESDPHIPLARIGESKTVFEVLGATTTTEVFPGAGHGIVTEEISRLRSHLNSA